MTLVEARDWVEQQIRPLEFSSGEIDRLINLENDRLARELRIPSRLIRNIDATQPFLLAANTRESGVVRIWNDETGERVPFYSVVEAHEKYPRWLDTSSGIGGHKFVVWEPYNLTAPLVPRGFFLGDFLRVLTIVKPNFLEADLDVLFDGELPEFHDLVPRKVASDILFGFSDKITAEPALSSLLRRGGLLRDEFQEGMRSAFARAWMMGGMR